MKRQKWNCTGWINDCGWYCTYRFPKKFPTWDCANPDTCKMYDENRWYIRLWEWAKKDRWCIPAHAVFWAMIYLFGLFIGHILGMACAIYIELKIMGMF